MHCGAWADVSDDPITLLRILQILLLENRLTVLEAGVGKTVLT